MLKVSLLYLSILAGMSCKGQTPFPFVGRDYIPVQVLHVRDTSKPAPISSLTIRPEQAPDTLTPVWLLVVDTAHVMYAEWGLKLTEKPDSFGMYRTVDFGNVTKDYGYGVLYSRMIPAFRRTLYDAQGWITGHEYLDDKKRPLPVTLVVWGEMERRAAR